jgi:hypothetical protein
MKTPNPSGTQIRCGPTLAMREFLLLEGRNFGALIVRL